jgi:hypothetical protein
MKAGPGKLRAELRRAVADYIGSEGCDCCEGPDHRGAHLDRLAKLLDVPPYADGSGWDFGQFEGGAK